MFAKLKSIREEQESGFTLIELLVVILIIGILAAIAIPMFLNQRKSAVDASVQSDVKNAATTVETALVKSGGTVVTVDAALASSAKVGTGTTLTYQGDSNGYCITASNAGGDTASGNATANTGNRIVYASLEGGIKTISGALKCTGGKVA